MKLRRAGVSLLAAVAAVLALRVWPTYHASGSGAPRLVLVVVVDQMRYDYLTRFGPLFHGGFRTLLDRGAVFSNAMYPYANTETGPGHSLLLSGRTPEHSGIVANKWYDALLKKDINVVEDPMVTTIGGAPAGGPGFSPINFNGFTLGDMLKKRNPGSKVVGISLKDRAAILMAGPRADAAYWFDLKSGHFVTSTYYMRSVPAWLSQWNERHLADTAAWRTWSRLLPDDALYTKYAGPDDVKGESDNVDILFPHHAHGAAGTEQSYDDLRHTPFGDELLLDATLEAMSAHQLGADDAADILAVSFSSTDVIGHTYGPDSQEMMDEYLRLDQTLGRLFDEVDRRVGLDRVIVALSADHAVQPLIELSQARGVAARRVTPTDILNPVTEALDARFGAGNGIIARYIVPDFYWNLDAIARRGLARQEVEEVAEQAAMGTGLVERVYTNARMLGDPPADDPFFAFERRSFYQPRSPHLIVLLKKWSYVDERGGGTGHGTPYEYDRHVPVVFMGGGVKPGTYVGAAGPEDIAVTLGTMLHLDYPQQDAERTLTEMMRTE